MGPYVTKKEAMETLRKTMMACANREVFDELLDAIESLYEEDEDELVWLKNYIKEGDASYRKITHIKSGHAIIILFE